jgi:hypothetical protein
MTHTWRATGAYDRWYTEHSSREGGSTDSIGVGLGEDRVGPFGSRRLAQKVADALGNAYRLGWDDNEERHGGEEFAPADSDSTVTVADQKYAVLRNGDAVCPECGASRFPDRIADHMASEHGDNDEECEKK